jgi:hypothetical protein
MSASLALEGNPPPHQVRYTADGSDPGAASVQYRGALEATPDLRAGLLVNGRPVVSLAIHAAKSRIPATMPPGGAREPFHR